MKNSPFASKNLASHLLRGVVGFGLLGSGVVLSAIFGPIALILAPLGLIALRGCPGCWILGLIETLSRGHKRRACVDGKCELVTGGSPPAASEAAA